MCTTWKALIICTSFFTGSKDEELDSDDFEDDEEDGDDDDDEAQNGESQEQTGAEALGNLRKYMDEMDQELQSTNIGKSFTQNNGVSLYRCCLSCAHNLVRTFYWYKFFPFPFRPVIKPMLLKTHQPPQGQSMLKKKSSRLIWISTWFQIYWSLSLLRLALLGLLLTYCKV